MPKYFYFCIFLLFANSVFSQKKTLQTQFTKEKITLDGQFDEAVWQSAPFATDFVMIAPDNGKPIAPEKKSEVKILYDDNAVYVAANLYDDQPNKILSELTLRDNFATADHFGVFINGFNDGQQEYRFYVSAAGVMSDAIYTQARDEDFLWDAIWDSHVKITDFGWTVEMKIPYAALRFSSEQKQTWGINFYREIRRDRQQYSWSLINNKIKNESTQAGLLQGIENIKTPTRLFFIPYSSFYLHTNATEKPYGEFKGGLDIKYGVNDAFTLDAVLIPDFGQTKFDNVELNLGPFKQQFVENRSFFTEGIDLFSKGNLLYTRRIGETPIISVDDNETVVAYPSSIKLLNALKLSGRTKGGLGFGIMNAITDKTEVTIQNNDTNEMRTQTIAPLTNYNVFVLDQRFRKNSSVSLVNTNVTRNGDFRDANVSALIWDLNTKKNTYNLSGDFKYSFLNDPTYPENKKGYYTSLNLGDTHGNYRYAVGGKYVSTDYDNNDLGINFLTHYHSLYANGSYRILNPKKKLNTFYFYTNLYSEFENRTGKIQSSAANASVIFTDKKNDYYSLGVTSSPLKTYDFYEPRSTNQDKYLAIPENLRFFGGFSSNYNRKFALDIDPDITFYNQKNRLSYSLLVSPRYRFNDRFSLIYSFVYLKQNNNIGWVDFDDNGNTILARRNRSTYTNNLLGKYSINYKMNFNLNLRYYWSYALNNQYLILNSDGSLTEDPDYTLNKNSNLTTWNLDFSYSWWFAPGSQMVVLYRNNSYVFNREFSQQFGDNLDNALNNQNLKHIFSISIRYFIDYNSIKKF